MGNSDNFDVSGGQILLNLKHLKFLNSKTNNFKITDCKIVLFNGGLGGLLLWQEPWKYCLTDKDYLLI